MNIFNCFKKSDIQSAWEILSQNPAQMELVDIAGSNVLHYAASKNLDCFVDLFLQKNIGINCSNLNSMTPLFMAAGNNAIDTVKLLIERGAELDFANMNCATPLFMAARNGHDKIVKILLEAGANPYLCNINGVLPLEIANAKEHDKVVKIILKFCDIGQDDGDKIIYMKNYLDDKKKA